MYNSGDAAEQVVRMSLEGAEFALKITGSAAKNLAAALYTVLKDQKKTKGKAAGKAPLKGLHHQEGGLPGVCQASQGVRDSLCAYPGEERRRYHRHSGVRG